MSLTPTMHWTANLGLTAHGAISVGGGMVKAAHLVPKSLRPSEVFGVEELTEDFFYNWKLEALDQGWIAIIPVQEDKMTRWKCILINEEKRQDIALYLKGNNTFTRWNRNDNAKFLERVENKEIFWASPGSYLRKSTLVSLARNISGLELPPSLYQDTTFGSTDDSVDSTMITQQLLDATKK
ncbi:hypothetical protein V8E54_008062 [Elaphomyces granulatus]